MARKKLIAGNWKMNGLAADGVALAKGIATEVKALGKPQCEFLVECGFDGERSYRCGRVAIRAG